MITGVLVGLLSAVLQCCSYIASAVFLQRRWSPRELLFYSQGVQALVAMPLFFLLVPAEALCAADIWIANGVWLLMFSVTQLSMFQSQEYVEPSKIATWLGLKIVVLAVLTLIWPLNGETVCLWQGFAIVLMLAAVVVMNFSGGLNPGKKGALWLATFILVASFCDRQQIVVIELYRAHGLGLFRSSILTLALGYWTFGFVSALYIGNQIRRRGGGRSALVCLKDSVPFAAFWFTAMMSIYYCYGTLGAVFGNVVQSTRALLAVAIGYLACRYLGLGVEAPVSRALWLRRAAAAVLMTTGIIVYSLFRPEMRRDFSARGRRLWYHTRQWSFFVSGYAAVYYTRSDNGGSLFLFREGQPQGESGRKRARPRERSTGSEKLGNLQKVIDDS